jgi:hypothetical protein
VRRSKVNLAGLLEAATPHACARGVMHVPCRGHEHAASAVAQRKWRVGLRCETQPFVLVRGVLAALRGLGAVWKPTGLPYNFKCRITLPAAPAQARAMPAGSLPAHGVAGALSAGEGSPAGAHGLSRAAVAAPAAADARRVSSDAGCMDVDSEEGRDSGKPRRSGIQVCSVQT